MDQPSHFNDPGTTRPPRFPFVRRHPWLTTLAAIVLSLVALWFVLDWFAERRLNATIARLRAAGEPLTIEEVERLRRSYPDEENMALWLLEPGETLSAYLESEAYKAIREDLLWLGHANMPELGQRCTDRQLDASRAFLSEYPDLIATVHEAAKLPGGRYPIAWQTPQINTLLPHLGRHKHVIKVLALEATLAAHDADEPRVYAALRDAMIMSDVLLGEPTVIGGLVSVACQALCRQVIFDLLALTPLTDEHLADLLTRISDADRAPSLHLALLGERAGVFNTLSWVYAAGGTRQLRLAPDATSLMWCLLPGSKRMDLEALLRIQSRICDAAKLDPDAALQRARQIDQEFANLPGYCVGTKMIMPATSRFFELWMRSLGENRAARAILATERFRLRQGRWPEQLSDLVPEFLDAVPQDPFDNKPLRFEIREGDICIWSIGEDLRDDGGAIHRVSLRKPTDWGYCLLPPHRRNRPAATHPSAD